MFLIITLFELIITAKIKYDEFIAKETNSKQFYVKQAGSVGSWLVTNIPCNETEEIAIIKFDDQNASKQIHLNFRHGFWKNGQSFEIYCVLRAKKEYDDFISKPTNDSARKLKEKLLMPSDFEAIIDQVVEKNNNDKNINISFIMMEVEKLVACFNWVAAFDEINSNAAKYEMDFAVKIKRTDGIIYYSQFIHLDKDGDSFSFTGLENNSLFYIVLGCALGCLLITFILVSLYIYKRRNVNLLLEDPSENDAYNQSKVTAFYKV